MPTPRIFSATPADPVPLGDRVRLLAALDEDGSIPVAECLGAFRETRSMAGLSSLILHRFVASIPKRGSVQPVRCCHP